MVGRRHLSHTGRTEVRESADPAPGSTNSSWQSFDISIAPIDLNATQPVEDASPSPSKVFRNDDGNLVVADVDGLKIGVRWRLDGKGYDISNGQS